jgi:leucyl aminopeptidase (aminopeptidase T)
MKTLASVTRLALFTMLVLGLFFTAIAQEQKEAQSQSFEALARKVVSTSANIKPGDVVVIQGGKHTIPLMEALAIEVQKAGGLVTMFLTSDRVVRSRYIDVPEKYLELEPRQWADWLKPIDVWISLPEIEDYKAMIAGVPENRFAKAAKSWRIIENMVDEAKIREVEIGYPTKEDAANNQLDFATFEKMHWAAVNADYKLISEKGNAIKAILKAAKTVRVTSPSDTDFTFSIGDRPIFVNDGIVTEEKARSKFIHERYASLPGGEVFFAAIEISANGKVAVAKTRCRYEPLAGVSFEFKNGKMENFKAEKGSECFTETMAPYSGPKDMFAGISIGLNPELKVIEDGGDYRPNLAAGMVEIGVGDNRLVGGNNNTLVVFWFPIVRATVTVDGKVVVKDGKITL